MGGSNGMFDPGNVNVAAPYTISGRSGALTGRAANDFVATLVQFGMADPRTPGAIVPTPIRVSQVRMKYTQSATAPTIGIAFELLKGTKGAQSTGGASHTAQRRKTTGYPAIALTETSLHVSTTGAIDVTGAPPVGFVANDDTGPLDMMALGGGTGFEGSESIWRPDDLCGITLEAGECLAIRLLTAQAGTGIFFCAFDFLR
jgi:hypothetical protein